MKIRVGNVSNSSSSSFMLYGQEFDNNGLISLVPGLFVFLNEIRLMREKYKDIYDSDEEILQDELEIKLKEIVDETYEFVKSAEVDENIVDKDVITKERLKVFFEERREPLYINKSETLALFERNEGYANSLVFGDKLGSITFDYINKLVSTANSLKNLYGNKKVIDDFFRIVTIVEYN